MHNPEQQWSEEDESRGSARYPRTIAFARDTKYDATRSLVVGHPRSRSAARTQRARLAHSLREDDAPHTLHCVDPFVARGGHRRRLQRGAVHFAGTCRIRPLLSGYYVKASLLVAVYLMLRGSNQDYDRVRVSARTAFASTAILTLTLEAATARERVPRPTAADQRRAILPFFLSVLFPFFFPLFSFSFFYLLSGIWRVSSRYG